SGQLPEAERLFCRRVRDLSIGDDERTAFHFQLRGGEVREHLARGGSGLAQLRVHRSRRQAAERPRVPWRQVRVAHHQADGGERRAQIFSDRLSERGADVLSHFNLSGVNSDGAVFPYMEPRPDLLWHLPARPASPSARLLLGVRPPERKDDQNTAAQRLEEIAPGQLEVIRGAGGQFVPLGLNESVIQRSLTHCEPPFCALSPVAARRMAARMRGYVPQRQMLPSIARRISGSVG